MAGGIIGNSLLLSDPYRARTNILAQGLVTFLNSNNRDIVSRQLRVSTGERTLRPEDGAAFFAIAKKAEARARATGMAMDNLGDAKDALSLAEAGLLRIDELLSHSRDLAVRAANDTLTDEQRADIQLELEQLAMAIDEVVQRTRFNETELMLDGGFEQTYQVGPEDRDQLTLKLGNFLASALDVDPASLSVANHENAADAIAAIDLAIGRVKDQLMVLGGFQSGLTDFENILSSSLSAVESIESLYGDADLALEQVALTKLNLFSQLASSQAAAVNLQPGSILSVLLGG